MSIDFGIDEIRQSIARDQARRARWPNDLRLAMSKLAGLFPTMRGVPGTSPWKVEDLLQWMSAFYEWIQNPFWP